MERLLILNIFKACSLTTVLLKSWRLPRLHDLTCLTMVHINRWAEAFVFWVSSDFVLAKWRVQNCSSCWHCPDASVYHMFWVVSPCANSTHFTGLNSISFYLRFLKFPILDLKEQTITLPSDWWWYILVEPPTNLLKPKLMEPEIWWYTSHLSRTIISSAKKCRNGSVFSPQLMCKYLALVELHVLESLETI